MKRLTRCLVPLLDWSGWAGTEKIATTLKPKDIHVMFIVQLQVCNDYEMHHSNSLTYCKCTHTGCDYYRMFEMSSNKHKFTHTSQMPTHTTATYWWSSKLDGEARSQVINISEVSAAGTCLCVCVLNHANKMTATICLNCALFCSAQHNQKKSLLLR